MLVLEVPPDQWDDIISAIGAAVAVVIAAVGGVWIKRSSDAVKAVQASADQTADALAAVHTSLSSPNGGSSVKDALNRIEQSQASQAHALQQLGMLQSETRKDVGGIREDIRDLRKRDDRDRDEAAEGRARLQDQIDALNT